MADNIWEDRIKLQGWPEEGTRSMSIDDLYAMFKRRLDLESHKADCDYRGSDGSWDCSCGLTPNTEGAT